MPLVNVKVVKGIAEVVLSRPKVNAMSRELIEQLGAAFRRVEDDPEVRGALLLAEGRCFSAGLDLREVAGLDRTAMDSFLDLFNTDIRPVFTCSKPVAAAVAGHAIAGGLVLALCADFLALGEGDYRLGLTELLVGVPFPREAFEAVRCAVPPRALRRLVYSAELLAPAEAFELGVGDVLVSDPEAAARFWLTLVTSRPLKTFSIAKRQVRGEAWQRIAAAPPSERQDILDAIFSPEVRQAVQTALR